MFKYAALLPIMVIMLQANPAIETKAAGVSVSIPQVQKAIQPAMCLANQRVNLPGSNEQTRDKSADQPMIAFANELNGADR
jgi:hypothetical protein